MIGWEIRDTMHSLGCAIEEGRWDDAHRCAKWIAHLVGQIRDRNAPADEVWRAAREGPPDG